MKFNFQGITYILGGTMLLSLFLAWEFPSMVKVNEEIHKQLSTEGYTNLEFISNKDKTSEFKCLSSVESLPVESVYFDAIKNREKRIVLACFTSFVYKIYDAKEIPSLPFLVSKASAIVAYSKENNIKALEITKTVIETP